MRRIYTIDYGCASTVGKVRKNNEDNFYCCSHIRLDPDSLDDVVLSGQLSTKDNDMLAVFDGMGGEACGEIASFIAANGCVDFCKDKAEYQEYLYELCTVLNDRVREETLARSLVLMGSTAAMIQFYKDEIYILNVGDSRIYKSDKDSIHQISCDHVVQGYSGKAPLTKFLGWPVEHSPLNPYIARGEYKVGDTFVLCTDGVSDMIQEQRLFELVAEDLPLDVIAKNIIDEANANGGRDNATVIVCKISHNRNSK